jgi:hypothetical protein
MSDNLTPKLAKYFFVGYPRETKGYYFYNKVEGKEFVAHNGILTEDVYMTQHEGFVDPKHSWKICKLQKSIYRLKQASRSWNLHFDEVVKGFSFIKSVEEPCVYKNVNGTAVVFLVIYVDDILMIGNDILMMEAVKSSLRKSFSMKDLEEAAFCHTPKFWNLECD